jgi:hypothetical protein
MPTLASPGRLMGARSSGEGVAAATLPLSAVTVRADGESVSLTLGDSKDGGTWAGLNDHTDPSLALTVTSKSWTDAGVETTLERTVYATKVRRKPYPDHATIEETESGADLNVILMLSDYIHSGETVTWSAAEALYTDDGTGGSTDANTAQTGSVTNSSALEYPLPIGMWLTPDKDWCEADTYTARIGVAHQFFRSGQTVRAVKFIATDESANSASAIATSMSKVSYTGSGLSGSCFEAALDFTGLTQGDMVTLDAIIYPWVGDAYQISVDGVSYPSPNLTTRLVLNDRTGAYGKVYAYVDGTGGSPAVHETAATAATTPYDTIANAAAGLQTYINANFSRNNVSGGIIRLTATSHTHSTYSARAVGDIPLIIEAADAGNKATTIYQDSGANAFNSIPDLLRIRNVTLKKTAASITFLDSNATNNGDFRLTLENCAFNINGQTLYKAWINLVGHLDLINCDGDDIGQGAYLSNDNYKQTNAWGSSAGSVGGATFNAFACKALNGVINPGVATGMQTPVGTFLGFSHIASPTNAQIIVAYEKVITAAGFGMLGNVFEQYGGATGPVMQISGSATLTAENVLDIANTWVGARTIFLYNETSVQTQVKRGITSLSVHNTWNSKSDVFATDGACIGNWGVVNRVGSLFRALLRGGDDATAIGSPGAWAGELVARGDVTGSVGTPLVADWTDDQSFTVAGTGNGDYTPGASTALPQVPAGMTAFPFDQKGRAVPTGGTAYVGAIQKAA